MYLSVAKHNNPPVQIMVPFSSIRLVKNDVLCAGTTRIITVCDEIIICVEKIALQGIRMKMTGKMVCKICVSCLQV